ncbi:protein FAM13A isoform X2 [Clupea harengus]|uniref:Protein FAM13A isoform X2 n=1 Tax=Clupea harengus TaxID=7950 RepID=A0A6P8ET24_CLUHA|nr:protein FAM13A isoform X2 [Clupea harengus]
MGAGALTICHNKAAVQIKEDMKKMVQLPMMKPRPTATEGKRVFGVSLLQLRELGLVADGVPLVVRSMVEYLQQHGLHQEGLFRVNGSVRAVDALRQRLERCEVVDLAQESEVCTVASLLKQFLRDLPEGLVNSSVQAALIQQHQESSEEGCSQDTRELLQQLPDLHHSLLKYLCHFLTQVDQRNKENRMNALNLATVFGPNVFHVSSGFDGIQEQNICNKIMATLIQNYSAIFERDIEKGSYMQEIETAKTIIVKEVQTSTSEREKSPYSPTPKARTPVPRKKKALTNKSVENCNTNASKDLASESPTVTTRKKMVKKLKSEMSGQQRVLPQPALSAGLPNSRPLPLAPDPSSSPRALSPSLLTQDSSPSTWTPTPQHSQTQSQSPEAMELAPEGVSLSRSVETLSSPQISQDSCRPDLAQFLERTIRSAVEQHLFDVHMHGAQSSDDPDTTSPLASPVSTARQRRRQQRELDEAQTQRDREGINKENDPSIGVINNVSVGEHGPEHTRPHTQTHAQKHSVEGPRHRKSKHVVPTLAELRDNQDSPSPKECFKASKAHDHTPTESMEYTDDWDEHHKDGDTNSAPTPAMKIQETLSGSDPGEGCADVPRLDLSSLTEDNNWGDSPFFSAPFLDFKNFFQQCYYEDPVPAYSSWQRESMDREEARLSPHAGGRLIRQLLEEDSDPMVSPRFYAYGHCQQYLDDTEVPPSPPNAHSFASRRRSSSLGSCDDDREELTSAQLSKKIHSLRRKIRKFDEKFEEERKYRPSHGDKAGNPEVLKWMNELAKLGKDLKEHKLLRSEEDLTPLPRQRSNTLPKSFGSQLEKKPAEAKAPKPPVETTLETVMAKLQEKRLEVGRPEDVKDMTREQIAAEKVALQKALLYYESIHGRPVTKSERQIMKPLYDRYRLVKQILCRASTIPVIGSPSSKRRCPLLQPIIEGVPALFFDDIKEEEDGSEDDAECKTQFTVTVKPELNMLGFLDQLDEGGDTFISPVDELSPSRNSTDMRLSNLHAATMPELVEHLQEAREEKKRIRKNLREFEDQFFRQNGRNVQKEDRSPLAVEYNEYKHIKAKLRLLEVLISKRDSSKFI